ncbi:hypothetical protein Tco_1112494 [Tanacetum coccineum]|uniref:Uncharacterized protein n=1 Tax=Tanacetum coccineum TaxID=301880 RepID=A0ABQ5IPI5_9ASTR
MHTRCSNYPNNSNVTIPRRRRRHVSNIVEPEIRTIVAPMAERTMEELLRAPTEGMNATSSKTDERIDKLADQLSTLVEIVSKKVVTPAPVKAVEESCVTCGGAHSWYNCQATVNNQASVCATTGTYNQVNPPNRVSNQMAPPGFAPVQNNGQNRFNQNQVQGNNFNRGNNFHGNQESKPTEKHLKEVKRIFRYLRGTINMGLWYMKDSGFELTGFLNADYAGCKGTFKSTSGGAQFLDEKLTDYQLGCLFTKALSVDRFNYLVRHLGMRSLSPTELERLAKSRQNQRDLPRNTPLNRVEVLEHQSDTLSIHSDEWKSFYSQHQTALRFPMVAALVYVESDSKETSCINRQ